MAAWRFDVADGYFGEPVAIKNAETWWRSDCDIHLEFAAEEAAEQYFRHHDGWEDSWPVTFHIFPPHADSPVSVVVEIEHEPAFNGSVVKATS